MELLKEAGTEKVTGQDAMLFMLLERLEKLEQECRQDQGKEAVLRADVARLSANLDDVLSSLNTDRLNHQAQIGHVHAELLNRVPGGRRFAFSMYVVVAACAVVNTLMTVHSKFAGPPDRR